MQIHIAPPALEGINSNFVYASAAVALDKPSAAIVPRFVERNAAKKWIANYNGPFSVSFEINVPKTASAASFETLWTRVVSLVYHFD
ncbi:MAG: hypothetical protein MUF81_00405 [Verrucomicrobia bacterium]|jgi:hypothetical protein|nr:hypothetical protein [Verrucomicrobiota bacterium]